MKKQYFFGYLFARSAKELALLVLAIGAGFCFLQYSQANTSASASAYQPSTPLHRALTSLTETFSSTTQTVAAFNAGHQVTTPKVELPQFPSVIRSNTDFAAVEEMLLKVDEARGALKQSVVARFEELTKRIEAKLRAYAASVGGNATPAGNASVVATAAATPSDKPASFEGLLFSPRLSSIELSKRSADLSARKEFLKVLETKAENPENRVNLTEAVAQLDSLSRLLPPTVDVADQRQSTSSDDQNRTVLPSERVAAQLEQLRAEVRQMCLTSWSLDENLDQATDLNSIEREKCRVAALANKGIWLSAAARILVALLVAVMSSFVILVAADLVKTFLDTASHTGVVADAINAMRGSTIIAKNQMRQPWPHPGPEIN
jgi:hypothetical protein